MKVSKWIFQTQFYQIWILTAVLQQSNLMNTRYQTEPEGYSVILKGLSNA